jgi:hypothetical protein
MRTQLAGDVETIARHLDTERNRLRAALGDMLTWVDEHVQPAASLLAQPSASSSTPSGSGAPAPMTAHESGRSESDSEDRNPTGVQPPRPAPPGQPGQTIVGTPAGSRITEGEATSPGDRQGTMPLPDNEDVRAGVPR